MKWIQYKMFRLLQLFCSCYLPWNTYLVLKLKKKMLKKMKQEYNFRRVYSACILMEEVHDRERERISIYTCSVICSWRCLP